MKRILAFAALFLCGCPLDSIPIPHADGGTMHDAGVGGGGGGPMVMCEESSDCVSPPDECHVGTCNFDGSCSYNIPAPAGNVCEGKGVCDGDGNCVAAGKECMTNSDCDDGDECTGDVCYNASHTCGHYAVPECTPKMCHGSSDCDDGDPCTNDVCHTFSGTCFHSNLTDGTPCPSGVCLQGACVPN